MMERLWHCISPLGMGAESSRLDPRSLMKVALGNRTFEDSRTCQDINRKERGKVVVDKVISEGG